MKSLFALMLLFSTSAGAANQCRRPLEKLVRSAEETAGKYGADCLKALKNGDTPVGEAAKKQCKTRLGREEYSRQAAILRKTYDMSVRVCAQDCEGQNGKLCTKGLNDLVKTGTAGAWKSLRKIKD